MADNRLLPELLVQLRACVEGARMRAAGEGQAQPAEDAVTVGSFVLGANR